jgi:hypothetical protein
MALRLSILPFFLETLLLQRQLKTSALKQIVGDFLHGVSQSFDIGNNVSCGDIVIHLPRYFFFSAKDHKENQIMARCDPGDSWCQLLSMF